jgi:hypothetical protein
MRKGTQQEVTGVIVNEKLNVNRKDMRQFRAMLHNLKKNNNGSAPYEQHHLSSYVTGYANFIKMVNPLKGTKMQEEIAGLFRENILRMPLKTEIASLPKNATAPKDITPPTKDDTDKPWWNVV